MGGVTDWLLWRIEWTLFEWDMDAMKWKAVILIATVWIADSLFFSGLLLEIWLVVVVGMIVVIHLIPALPSATGFADKLNLIDLSEEQDLIRRFFSVIFSDITEYIEMLLDWLFGD